MSSVLRTPSRAPRKIPSQARSKDTVRVILDATTVVLDRVGLENLTVVDVAKTAGVSMGSVYQYFPTKEALLAAWEERVLVRASEGCHKLFVEEDLATPVVVVTRAAVGLVLDTLRDLAKLDGVQSRPEAREQLLQMGEALLAARLKTVREPLSLLPGNLDEAARIIVWSVGECAFAASRRKDIDHGAFREELVRMVVSYLAGPDALRS